MTDSVQVAVRVRPYIASLDGKKFTCGVRMNGPSTTVFNPDTNDERTFTFDYSFWSHNEGDSHYVDNKKVYDAMGRSVLDSAWEGYNVSLFAYGQTGSGKSHSMIGTKEEPGIVPLVADEVFQRIDKLNQKCASEGTPDAEKTVFEVKVAMMELYNEEIRDLLNPKGNPSGGLRIRESPTTGPFVQDLIYTKVKSYAEIEKTMDQGTAMRTVRQTQMNDKSSRAHTIVQIVISQKVLDTKKNDGSLRVSRESTLNLIDLAGSERQKDSGVSGAGLKEAIAINTSLTFLGKVITTLAEIADGKKNLVIPYRSSKLTFLLKNSLGGNSKTIMIAAVRPGADFYEESVSTLRYADSAKKIKNKPIVNEDPRDAAIRALKEEIERLKEQMSNGTSSTSSEIAADNTELEELRRELEMSQSIISQLQEQENEERDAELARLREQLLAKSGVIEFDRTQIPHMLNLQEDPQQSGLIAFPFSKVGDIVVGKTNVNMQPDIELCGFGIKKNHAVIRRTTDNRIFVIPSENGIVHRNGEVVEGEIEIFNNDRIIFGNTLLFRVAIPTAKGYDAEDNTFDWHYAQKEYVQKHLNAASAEKQREIEERMKQIEEAAKQQEQERLALEEERKKVQEKLQASMDDSAILELKKQLEAQQQAILDKEKELESLKNKKVEEELLLEEEQMKQDCPFQARVLELIHLVDDANEIARKIGKQYSYEMRVVHQIDEETGDTIEDLVVISKDLTSGLCAIIADEDFLVRIFKMKSIYLEYKNCKASGREWEGINPEDDPFLTEGLDEPAIYGGFNIPFVSLYTLKSTSLSCAITDVSGKEFGSVGVEIVPCDSTGNPDGVFGALQLPREGIYNSTTLSLIGKKISFLIRFTNANGLNPKHCHDTFIRYALPFDTVLQETQPCPGATENPTWKYSRLVTVEVTANLEKFFKHALLHALVYAKIEDGIKRKGVKELGEENAVLRAELKEARAIIKQLQNEGKLERSSRLNLERRVKLEKRRRQKAIDEEGPAPTETEEERLAREERIKIRLQEKAAKKERKAQEKAAKKARKAEEKAAKKARKAEEKAAERARMELEFSEDLRTAKLEVERLQALVNKYEQTGTSTTPETNTATPKLSSILAEKDKEIEALKAKIHKLESGNQSQEVPPENKKSTVCIIS